MVEEGTSFSGKRNLELDVNYTGHIFFISMFHNGLELSCGSCARPVGTGAWQDP